MGITKMEGAQSSRRVWEYERILLTVEKKGVPWGSSQGWWSVLGVGGQVQPWESLPMVNYIEYGQQDGVRVEISCQGEETLILNSICLISHVRGKMWSNYFWWIVQDLQ